MNDQQTQPLPAPVAAADSCGPDLFETGDLDFMNFMAYAEGLLPASFFSSDDGKPFDRSTVDFKAATVAAAPFLSQTKDVRLLALLAKFCVLNRDLDGERDVVLVRGLEPNMRWRGFCAELLKLASDLGVETTVALGALLADSPHTRPVPVSGTCSDPAAAAALGLEHSRYEGPTGIVGVFQDACGTAGLAAVSFWAAVPHYVAQPPCPKATLALLRRIEDVLDIPVPLGDLPDRARAWERQVDELAREDRDIAEYIASLERREAATDLPEASGEAIAREFERYLRRRPDEPGAD